MSRLGITLAAVYGCLFCFAFSLGVASLEAPGGGTGFAWVVLLGFLVIAGLIGGVFLRAAVSCYNAIVGGADSPTAVPKIRVGRAMGITLIWILVDFALYVSAAITSGQADGSRAPTFTVAVLVAFLLISNLVKAGMLSAMLPTTFLRGFLVALCHMLMLWVAIFTWAEVLMFPL